jgi:hypothetical protein
MKTVILAILVLAIGVYFFGYTSSSETFRPNIENCNIGIDLSTDNAISINQIARAKCATTEYRLPIANPKGEHSNKFTYSFLELNETEPSKLKDTRQLTALETALNSAKGQKFVIVFIHGWRHDAAIGDEDEKRFRTLLAYSRSFLNQREAKGRYLNAELFGVYIGWRGAQAIETGTAWMPLFIPTIWNRKAKSEAHAENVIAYLKTIEGHLSLNGEKDRMLVVGHSLGGNMLATALNACLAGNPSGSFACGEGDSKIVPITQYRANIEARAPIGNLTVLVNPAAEARKWADVQRLLRDRYGKPWKDGMLAQAMKYNDPLFKSTQKPTYISITATPNWHQSEHCTEEKCNNIYDSATYIHFPLSQLFATQKFESSTTIGHLLPSQLRPFGASHEIVTNKGSELNTAFGSSLNTKNSICDIQDGWLLDTRSIAKSRGESWDSGSSTRANPYSTDFARLFVSKKQSIYLQIRNALSPNTIRDKPNTIIYRQKPINVISFNHSPGWFKSFEPPYTPFWNIRATPNTIEEHGGYINYPLWCVINQMVLDNITAVAKAP